MASITVRYQDFTAKLVTPILPRRCQSTGRRLWFGPAYKIKATYETDSGFVFKQTFWMNTSDYLILSIKASAAE